MMRMVDEDDDFIFSNCCSLNNKHQFNEFKKRNRPDFSNEKGISILTSKQENDAMKKLKPLHTYIIKIPDDRNYSENNDCNYPSFDKIMNEKNIKIWRTKVYNTNKNNIRKLMKINRLAKKSMKQIEIQINNLSYNEMNKNMLIQGN